MTSCYAKMNHGIVIKMSNLENQNHVTKSGAKTSTTNFKMCLREPKIVLDKNVVTQYFKTKRYANNRTTSYGNKTKLEGKNQILVISEKCVDHIRNRLSVEKVSSNKNILVKGKEVVLEGKIFSENNNFFHNINEYIVQQSLAMNSFQRHHSKTQINGVCKFQPCNEPELEEDHNLVNSKNKMLVEGEPVDMECGDDILFTNGNNYDNENISNTKTEPVEMECGDDILYTNSNKYFDEDAATTLSESIEMECGDDILFTNGGRYYSYSDEDNTERNQDFSYSYEDEKANVLKDEIEQKIEIKKAVSPILDTFEEQEGEVYHNEESNYKTFIQQELHSPTTSQKSDVLNENSCTICEKCGKVFENLLLLKEHQFDSCGLKYFYTCKFCPSTSWYSSTLRNHIQVVHRRELDKENIDDIMEAIKQSKQLENNQSEELNFKKQILLIEARQKVTKKLVNRRNQTKKKIYINYNEIKRILKVSCFECNKDPEYVRGRTDQYCSQCSNEYTFQCRKCNRFYFKYDLAILHAKQGCKKQISKRTFSNSNKLKKIQENSLNTLPNKSSTRKYFTTFCVMCNESLDQDEWHNKIACRNCNKTSIQFQCENCKKIFEVETTAKRHSQRCHKQWRGFLINSSLSNIALLDHNYYCKNISEPRIKKIIKEIEQSETDELTLSQYKSAKRVYTGKKCQSIQS